MQVSKKVKREKAKFERENYNLRLMNCYQNPLINDCFSVIFGCKYDEITLKHIASVCRKWNSLMLPIYGIKHVRLLFGRYPDKNKPDYAWPNKIMLKCQKYARNAFDEEELFLRPIVRNRYCIEITNRKLSETNGLHIRCDYCKKPFTIDHIGEDDDVNSTCKTCKRPNIQVCGNIQQSFYAKPIYNLENTCKKQVGLHL